MLKIIKLNKKLFCLIFFIFNILGDDQSLIDLISLYPNEFGVKSHHVDNTEMHIEKPDSRTRIDFVIVIDEFIPGEGKQESARQDPTPPPSPASPSEEDPWARHVFDVNFYNHQDQMGFNSDKNLKSPEIGQEILLNNFLKNHIEAFHDPLDVLNKNLKSFDFTNRLENYLNELLAKKETISWFEQSTITDQIRFINAIFDGRVSNLCEQIKTAKPEEAYQAFEDLKKIWPWKHEHSFLAYQINNFDSQEKKLINLLGFNLMRSAETSLLSRMDVIERYCPGQADIFKAYIQKQERIYLSGNTVQLKMQAYLALRAIENKKTNFLPRAQFVILNSFLAEMYCVDALNINHIESNLQTIKKDLYQLKEEYSNLDKVPSQLNYYKDKRLAAIDSYLKKNDIDKFAHQKHDLSTQGSNLLTRYGIQQEFQNQLFSNFGNNLQQVSFRECVSVINELGSLSQPNMPVTELERFIIKTALLGCEASSAGYVTHAFNYADVCWFALDCIKGVGEGLADGTLNAAKATLNPLRTVSNLAHTVWVAGYYVGQTLATVVDLSYAYATHNESFNSKWDAYAEQFSRAYDSITDHVKNSSARDLLRASVSFVTETYLTGKFASNFNTLLDSSKKIALRCAQKIKTGEQVILTTAEGVQIRMARKAINAAGRVSKEMRGNSTARITTKVLNMNEFFKTDFGGKLKSFCEKTKITVQGSSVYKITKKFDHSDLKKGCYFYIDKLHLDHIEVFNDHGRIRAVLNLDGTYNKIKTDRAIAQARTIKI